MENLTGELVTERMTEFIENRLQQNTDFQDCQARVQSILDELEKRKHNNETGELFNKLNKELSQYVNTAYCLGYHHGQEDRAIYEKRDERKTQKEQTIGLEDMTELIYILDAYRDLNISLFGTEMVLQFNKGNLGALSRIYAVIQHNISADLPDDKFAEINKILRDTSLDPKERAKILLAIE